MCLRVMAGAAASCEAGWGLVWVSYVWVSRPREEGCQGMALGSLQASTEACSPPQNVPPDLAICCFILEQSLSVRALQEMLANTVEAGVEVRSTSGQAGHRDSNE